MPVPIASTNADACTNKPSAPKPAPVAYDSLAQMLALANMKEVPVVGDGNCGFSAYLAAEGKLEHSQRARQAHLPLPTTFDNRGCERGVSDGLKMILQALPIISFAQKSKPNRRRGHLLKLPPSRMVRSAWEIAWVCMLMSQL